MSLFTLVGILGACLTTLSFLPQTIKTLKEKNTEGISLLMYSMFAAGLALWVVYGIFTNDLPVILANSITLFFALIILGLKVKYN